MERSSHAGAALRSTDASALVQVLPLLRCPVCAARKTDSRLEAEQSSANRTPITRSLRCECGHLFDVAKQGYVTLLGGKGRTVSGDSAAQVLNRESFLRAGHYSPIAGALSRTVSEVLQQQTAGRERGSVVVEAGAGNGYYLASILDILSDSTVGIGTEISVSAAKRLARAHARAASVIADTWNSLPIATSSCDVVTVVFAPRNAAEFARILSPGGALVVVWPGPMHLMPLRKSLGMLGVENDKTDRMARELSAWFDFDGAEIRSYQWPLDLDAQSATELALMGPSGVHLDVESVRTAISALPQLEASIDIKIGVFPVRHTRQGIEQ